MLIAQSQTSILQIASKFLPLSHLVCGIQFQWPELTDPGLFCCYSQTVFEAQVIPKDSSRLCWRGLRRVTQLKAGSTGASQTFLCPSFLVLISPVLWFQSGQPQCLYMVAQCSKGMCWNRQSWEEAAPTCRTKDFYIHVYAWLVVQSCMILYNFLDCSPPGSSVQGILQARILSGLPFFSSG